VSSERIRGKGCHGGSRSHTAAASDIAEDVTRLRTHTVSTLSATLMLLIAAQCLGAPAEYRIQPGDALGIVADVGMPDYNPPAKVTVGPDGRFAYPLAGDVEAAGKTRQEVAAQIRDALLKLYRKVEVTVNVDEYRARNAFVLGEVLRPGPVAVVDETLTLDQAIAQVGGLTERAAEATLYRAGAEPQTVSVKNLGGAANERLGPGDVLNVGRRRPLMVVGEVAKPGPVDLPEGARLTDALGLAGGLGPEADAQHAALVNHESRTIVVDLQEVLNNPQGPINLPVADYHTLIVPQSRAVAVIGEVRSPGLYRAGHGVRLTGLIAQAGGLTPAAALTATAVEETGEVQTVDLSAAFKAPGSEADVPAHGFRTLVVPREPRQIIVLGEVVQPGVLTPQEWPLTLSGVLAEAKGPTAKADPSRVMVVRPDGTQETVDATPLVGAGGVAAAPRVDPVLASGSVVTVPTRYARVTVLGAVQEPGSYTFSEGDTVVDAIALAGGFLLKDAELRKVGLLRRHEDGVQVTEINLKTGLRGSQDLAAGPLTDRDVVFVPKSSKTNWGQVAAFLFGVGTVYSNVRR
jgi:protein involved in polysaccharide export with SLBB domain